MAGTSKAQSSIWRVPSNCLLSRLALSASQLQCFDSGHLQGELFPHITLRKNIIFPQQSSIMHAVDYISRQRLWGGGAENAGVENAGVENAGAKTYGKPLEQKIKIRINW